MKYFIRRFFLVLALVFCSNMFGQDTIRSDTDKLEFLHHVRDSVIRPSAGSGVPFLI